MDILEVNKVSVSEAEKRLKKLERDYQHSNEKYIETRSNWYRFYIKRKHSNHRSDQAGYCIEYYQDLRDRLKYDLEKLNRSEATQRGLERHMIQCKEFSKLHGCTSLIKENKILQQIEERQQQQHLENNDNVQETKHFRGIWEFSYYQSKIPKSGSSKAIHKLLRRVRDPEKSRDKAIASDYDPTSLEELTTRIEMEIKLLTKVINKIEKEERGRETKIDYDYEENMRGLKKKCDWICGKWDEEKKNIVELKKTHDRF